jgi:hypothetical protein
LKDLYVSANLFFSNLTNPFVFFENWHDKAGVAFEEDVLRITKTKGFVKFEKNRFAETYKSFNDDLIELNTNA